MHQALPYDPNSREGQGMAEVILRRHEVMEERRRPYERIWTAIAERCDPAGAVFGQDGRVTPGQHRTERVFDATPGLALSRFAAATVSLVTPRHERYHGFRAVVEELNDDDEIVEYTDELTRRVFAARYAPLANFEDQVQRFFWSIGGYGTQAMFCDEAIGRGLRYRCPHLSQLYFGESFEGRVDRVHRKWRPNSRQIAQKFFRRDGAQKSIAHLPAKLREDLDKSGGMAEWTVLQCTGPNAEIDYARLDHAGMEFVNHYVMVDEKFVLEEGGYRTNPWAVSRYQSAPEEEYGRSPAWLVMPDILQLNEVKKTMIRRAQLIVEPPIMTDADGALEPFLRLPGAINPGWLGADGRPRAVEMQTAGDLGVGLDMVQDLRGVVNEAFHLTLFQVLAERAPNETATAALLKAQERGQLLAPILGRQQSEFLGNLITRELSVLEMAGQLPPMPQKLIDAGGVVDIEYQSPLNRMQMSDEAVGLLRTVEILLPLAQVDQSVLDALDMDQIPGIVARATGAPAKAIRSEDQVAEIRAQRQQERDAELLLKAAPVVASTARELQQSQATAGNAPQPIPYVQPET